MMKYLNQTGLTHLWAKAQATFAPRWSPVVNITANTTLTAAHAGCLLQCSGDITITIPAGVLAVGAELELCNYGSGTISIAAASGVTIRSKDGALTLPHQYTCATLKQMATDEWLLVGDLA